MKILANDGISPTGIKALEAAGMEVLQNKVAQERLVEFINSRHVGALLVRSATKVGKDVIDGCPDLKMIGRGGVGMDNIDVEYARSKGIKVFNTPGASSKSVAELVFAHLFALSRHLHDSNRVMPLEGESRFKELKKQYASGTELSNKTLGILGFGKIGQETAKLAIGLGMKVMVYDLLPAARTLKLEFFNGSSMDFEIVPTSLEEVLKNADFVSLHVPAQDKPLLNRETIALMKDGAGLVNAARGGVLDEEALLEALDSGKLSYAGLDVFENEPQPDIKVLMHPKLSMSPHIGAATKEAQDRIGLELAEQIISYSDE